MNILNSISIFDNDKYFLGLLNGYCYANNIILNDINFNMEGVQEMEASKPNLVFFSLDLLNIDKEVLDKFLTSVKNKGNQVMVCGLNKGSSDICASTPGWFDDVINDSICDVDWFIKKNFYFDIRSTNDRRFRERRHFKERRNGKLNHFSNNYPMLTLENDINEINFKGLKIDQRNKCVFLNERRVDLTPKEFDLIDFLSKDIERVYTAEEIINHIWPKTNRATKSDLYQYMHLLRKKIENDPTNPKWIVNIKGFGYRLNLRDTTIEKRAFI